MLVRVGWVLAALCVGASIAPVRAEESSAPIGAEMVPEQAQPQGGVLDDPGAASVDAKAAKISPYPKIYQGPLFGSLFARSLTEQKVDETALRYYASLHNIARVEAEIRRLKALYPNWIVPTNIYSAGGSGNDEQPFWDLFAAGRMEELHAGIALRIKGEPGWKPSRDLISKIERKEAVDRLVKASNAHSWTEVLEIANRQPSVLHCAYIDADWRVAEAFVGIGATDRAFEIYHAIIAACTDHDERLATVRKSIAIFSVDEVLSLIALGTKSSDGAAEFDGVVNDLTRARIGAVNAGRAKDDIEPAALAGLFDEIERTHEKSDLALAGWYEYGRGRFAQADRWFTIGLPAVQPSARDEDEKFAEGHALSLIKLGRADEARAFAWEWRDASMTMRAIYSGAMIALLTRADPLASVPDAALDDFVALVNLDRSFDGAQALAWYHQNRKDFENSAVWFKSALAREGVDPATAPAEGPDRKELAKAIEGYVIALENLARFDEALAIADAWRQTNLALRGLFISVVTEILNQPEKAAILTPERIAHYAQAATADRSVIGAQNLGWLSYRESDWSLSIDWFGKAIAWSPNGKGDAKINEGYALALKGAGRLAEAEEVAWVWRDQSSDLRSAYFGVMVIQLSREDLRDKVSDARIERFARLVRLDHSAEGAQALGWYRLHQANCGYAVDWFRVAIAWTADHQGDSKMNEGLAQALRSVGAFNEAEDVAWAWRERSPDLRALYVKIVVEELTREWPVVAMGGERMERFSRIVLADHSSVGAQALGWRRYGEAGCGYGVDWFRLATSWSGDSIGDAKMNEGYALTLRAVGRLSEAEAISWPWIDRIAAMKKLYVDVVVDELSRDNPPEPMPETRIGDFMATIEPIHSPLGAQALGWYRYERHENGDAAKWFKNALDWWPALKNDPQQKLANPVEDYVAILAKLALTHEAYRRTPRAYPNSSMLIGKVSEVYVATLEGLAKTFEGYALALRTLGRVQEAEAIAWEWRERWPALRALYIEIAISELGRTGGEAVSAERLARYAAVINADRSMRGAQALGWHGYARQDFAGASEWFKASLDWAAADPNATPDPKIVEAWVLSLRGAKRFAEALDVVSEWRDKMPGLQQLFIQIGMEDVTALESASPAAAAKLAALANAIGASKSAEGALAFGWLAYQRKDFATAMQWFRQAIVWAPDGKPDDKALEGFALSLHALGKTEDMLTFSYQWSENNPAMKPVFIGAVIEALANAQSSGVEIAPEVLVRASAAFAQTRSVAGAEALAWQRINVKDWVTAAAWFKAAVQWSPDGAGDAKMAEGLTIALRNLNRFDEAQTLAYSWAGRSDDMRSLYIEIIADRLTRRPPSAPNDEEMRRFAALVSARSSANGAQALGWYSFNAHQGPAAAAWFERAMAWEPSEDSALGLAFAYRLLRDRTAYFRIIDAYRDRYGKIADLALGRSARNADHRAAFESAPQTDDSSDDFSDAPRTRKKHASVAGSAGRGALAKALYAKDYIGCIKSAEAGERNGALGAGDEQIKGWCLLGLGRPQEAAIAFDRALAGSHGKPREDAAYGKSLALLQNDQVQPAAAAAGSADLSPERREEIGVQVLSRRAYGAYEAQRYLETLELLDRRAQFAPETRDLMSLRAWSLKNIGRVDEAAKIFQSLDAQLSTSQTNDAVSITSRRN
jgi:tetratricopeptide (TPR) repeat protein